MSTTISVDGRARSYRAVGSPDGPAGRPLVLVFHGSKQDAEKHRAFTDRMLDRLAMDQRAVVAYLDGYRGNWNDARAGSAFPARLEQINDVDFVRAVVEDLVASHRVDADRVIGVGYSNGGQMVFRLLHEVPEVLAGAVVTAATMPDAANFLLPFGEPAARPVPITLIAGTSDRIARYDGGTMAWWARALFKVSGTSLSARETASYFAQRNRLDIAPVRRELPAAPSAGKGVRMEVLEYGTDTHAPVTLYTVVGGGHTIPGTAHTPALIGRVGRERGLDDIVRAVLVIVGR